MMEFFFALAAASAEVPVKEIPLTGKLAEPGAEISGMAWHGDTLVFLPQYAVRVLYVLSKEEVFESLSQSPPTPLSPREVPFTHLDLPNRIWGFDGYEAIAIQGDRIYLAIEANVICDMSTFIVSGTIAEDHSVRLDPEHHVRLDMVSPLCNFAAEALVPLHGGGLLVLPEVWSRKVNEGAVAIRLNPSLDEIGRFPLPDLAYRITDATQTATNGTFWIANYFWPGDTNKLALEEGEREHEVATLPQKTTHRNLPHLERLVQMRFDGDTIARADRAPIWFKLQEEDGRNWEALAPLDDEGFLIMTDEHPRSIFGYVELPKAKRKRD